MEIGRQSFTSPYSGDHDCTEGGNGFAFRQALSIYCRSRRSQGDIGLTIDKLTCRWWVTLLLGGRKTPTRDLFLVR
jgi:hypothetical protein